MKGTQNFSKNMFSIQGSCAFTNSFRRENKITDPKNIPIIIIIMVNLSLTNNS